MKIWLLVASLYSTAAVALPIGQWQGTGASTDQNGQVETFTQRVTLSAAGMVMEIDRETTPLTYTFSFDTTATGFIDGTLVIDGASSTTIQGYCGQSSCQLTTSVPFPAELTYWIDANGDYHELGSGTDEAGARWWFNNTLNESDRSIP